MHRRTPNPVGTSNPGLRARRASGLASALLVAAAAIASAGGKWDAARETAGARRASLATEAEFVLERREGGRVHDVVAFDGGTWVAYGTVVGRLVETETERLVLDPVIPFDDALPRHLAVVGDALTVVAAVQARDELPAHSRVTLWRAGDVARGVPGASLDLDVVADDALSNDERLLLVGPAERGTRSQIVVLAADAAGALEVTATQVIDRVDSHRQMALGGHLLHAVVERSLPDPPYVAAHLVAYDVADTQPVLVHDEPLPFDAYRTKLAAKPDRLLVVDGSVSANDDGLRLLDTAQADASAWPVVHRQRWPYNSLEPHALAFEGERVLGIVDVFGLISFDARRPFERPEADLPQDACWYHDDGLWLVDDAVLWPCDGLREDVVADDGALEYRTTRRHADGGGTPVADARRVCIGDFVVGPICLPWSGGPTRFLVDDASAWRFRTAAPLALGAFGLLAGGTRHQPGRVDVLDPDAPAGITWLGGLGDLPMYRGAAAAGQAGYLLVDGEDTRGVQAIDVRDAASPQRAGLVTWPRAEGSPTGGSIAAGDGRVVVAAESTLTILDAADPLAPRVVGSIVLEGSIVALALQGGTAYVGFNDAGPPGGSLAYALAAIDVSDADAPREVWRMSLEGSPHALAIDGDRLFVTERTLLRAFDVSGAAGSTPSEAAAMPLPNWWARGLAASGDRAAVALGDGGLWVVRLEGASRTDTFLPVGYAGAVR